MPRRPSHFRQADVERTVKAARAAGLPIGGLEVAPDGTIRIITAEARESVPASPFDQWKAKRDARSAQGA